VRAAYASAWPATPRQRLLCAQRLHLAYVLGIYAGGSPDGAMIGVVVALPWAWRGPLSMSFGPRMCALLTSALLRIRLSGCCAMGLEGQLQRAWLDLV